MKEVYGQSMLEHPGHPDQSVHGRKKSSRGPTSVVGVSLDQRGQTAKSVGNATFTRVNKNGLPGRIKQKTYKNISNASMARLAKVLNRGVAKGTVRAAKKLPAPPGMRQQFKHIYDYNVKSKFG